MKKLIFIVDDSRTIRTSLQYMLERGGYEVVAAENGMDAMQQLEKLARATKLPSMIIADINMPLMDGIVLIKNIREQAVFNAIPILALTTEHREQKKLAGKAAGASGWLMKPVKAEQLIGVVEKFVK
jgi:two-component system chemotaxis response regulator CheY